MNTTQRKAVASSLSNLLDSLQGNVTDAALWFKEHHVLTQSDCEQIEALRFTAQGPRARADHLLSLLQVKDNSWNKLLQYLEVQHMGDLKTKLEDSVREQMGNTNAKNGTTRANLKHGEMTPDQLLARLNTTENRMLLLSYLDVENIAPYLTKIDPDFRQELSNPHAPSTTRNKIDRLLDHIPRKDGAVEELLTVIANHQRKVIYDKLFP